MSKPCEPGCYAMIVGGHAAEPHINKVVQCIGSRPNTNGEPIWETVPELRRSTTWPPGYGILVLEAHEWLEHELRRLPDIEDNDTQETQRPLTKEHA